MKFKSTIVSIAAVFLGGVSSLVAQKYADMISDGTFPLSEIQVEAENYFKDAGTGRGTGYKQYKRWEYTAQMELDDNGIKISNNALISQARLNRRSSKRGKNPQLLGVDGEWKELGPTSKSATSGWNPGVGRVTSIGLDDNNANHMIVGGPNGGVWKTTDAGTTWAAMTDNYSTMDVYSLEISPFNSNVYIWGSTNGKVYKSTDGGVSWNTSGDIGNGDVNRILFHPIDVNIVFAVSSSSGLSRSTDGGANWTNVQSGAKGYDVEFKPGDPSVVYFSGTRVYKSTDSGVNFTELTGFSTSTSNYKMMAVSAVSAEILYVLESDGGVFEGFYKSTNSGASFTKLKDGANINYFGYDDAGADDSGQAPRDMDVAASPTDANEVHIAGIHTWKSFDGGSTFALSSYWTPNGANSRGVGYNHADIDILKYSSTTLYVGSDGGYIRVQTKLLVLRTDLKVWGLDSFTRLEFQKQIRMLFQVDHKTTEQVL